MSSLVLTLPMIFTVTHVLNDPRSFRLLVGDNRSLDDENSNDLPIEMFVDMLIQLRGRFWCQSICVIDNVTVVHLTVFLEIVLITIRRHHHLSGCLYSFRLRAKFQANSRLFIYLCTTTIMYFLLPRFSDDHYSTKTD